MTDGGAPLLSTPTPPRARTAMQTALLLATIYLIFFTQYSSVSVLAPFFPTSEAAQALGETTVGLIFAAYPLGIVLATPLPPLIMRTFGAGLSIGLGLLVSGVATLGFGYLPGSLGTGSPAMLSAALMAMRAVGGMGSAFADVGTFTVITTVDFGSRLGAVISMVEVVIGLAGAGGTLAGGMLYELGASTPFGAFRFPFLVMAACSVALVPLVCVALPCGTSATLSEGESGEGGTRDIGVAEASTAGAAGVGVTAGATVGSGAIGRSGLTSVTIPDSAVSIGDGELSVVLSDSAAVVGVAPPASDCSSGARLWTYRRVLTLTSTLAGSALLEATYPTLPPKLKESGLGTARIGELFAMNGVAYFLGALAGGCLIDRYATQALHASAHHGALTGGCLIDRYAARAARQRVMGSGWVLMCISYACFGPLAALPASDVTQLAFIILGMFGQVSDLDGPSIPSNDLDCLSSLIIVGMIGQGVGAGAIIVPSLPDAQDGLRTELDKAAVVAVWNSCLAGGGAVGPVLAAALTERYGFTPEFTDDR